MWTVDIVFLIWKTTPEAVLNLYKLVVFSACFVLIGFCDMFCELVIERYFVVSVSATRL